MCSLVRVHCDIVSFLKTALIDPEKVAKSGGRSVFHRAEHKILNHYLRIGDPRVFDAGFVRQEVDDLFAVPRGGFNSLWVLLVMPKLHWCAGRTHGFFHTIIPDGQHQ